MKAFVLCTCRQTVLQFIVNEPFSSCFAIHTNSGAAHVTIEQSETGILLTFKIDNGHALAQPFTLQHNVFQQKAFSKYVQHHTMLFKSQNRQSLGVPEISTTIYNMALKAQAREKIFKALSWLIVESKMRVLHCGCG
jgi:hypothetical protein